MLAGLVGATVTVFATTLDDAVWLVPYVGSSSSRWSKSARIIHAITFVLTLELLAIGAVLAALAIEAGEIEWGGKHSEERTEIVLGTIGALLCWTLALYFYIKKLRKRRKQQEQQQQHQEETARLSTSVDAFQNQQSNSYGSHSEYDSENDNENDNNPQREEQDSLGTVMSLTTLGALDEISYFPALVVGKIFTPMQICLGTLLAALLVLATVTTCLARFKPLADCLDRIPIYAVIALFGTILTLGVLYDIYGGDE